MQEPSIMVPSLEARGVKSNRRIGPDIRSPANLVLLILELDPIEMTRRLDLLPESQIKPLRLGSDTVLSNLHFSCHSY